MIMFSPHNIYSPDYKLNKWKGNLIKMIDILSSDTCNLLNLR